MKSGAANRNFSGGRCQYMKPRGCRGGPGQGLVEWRVMWRAMDGDNSITSLLLEVMEGIGCKSYWDWSDLFLVSVTPDDDLGQAIQYSLTDWAGPFIASGVIILLSWRGQGVKVKLFLVKFSYFNLVFVVLPPSSSSSAENSLNGLQFI